MVSRSRKALAGLVILLMTLVAGAAWAQAAALPAGILVVIRPARDSDIGLQSVVSSAVLVRLTVRRAAAVLAPAAEARGMTVEQLRSRAAAAGSQYLILCEFTTEGRQFRITVGLYDPAVSTAVRSATAEGRVDLSLDDIVEQGLEQALSGVALRQPAPELTPGAAAADLPAESPAAEPAAAPAEHPPKDRSFGDGEISSPSEQRTRLRLSAGAGPMITTGPAADYAKLGLLATLALGFQFQKDDRVLGLGILTGAGFLSASGAVSDAFIVAVPLGIDAGFGFRGGALGLSLHGSAGPAVLLVQAPATGLLIKVIPYALAGLTLDIHLTKALGLTVEASYALFLESLSFPFMAFTPEVSLHARF
jgi:hypothetical protein